MKGVMVAGNRVGDFRGARLDAAAVRCDDDKVEPRLAPGPDLILDAGLFLLGQRGKILDTCRP